MKSTIFLDDSEEFLEEDENECLLCKRKINLKNFPDLIEKALERKYCENLNNYFYLRNIAKVINQDPSVK